MKSWTTQAEQRLAEYLRERAAREGFATTVLLDLTAGVSRITTDLALDDLRSAHVTLTGTPIVQQPAP